MAVVLGFLTLQNKHLRHIFLPVSKDPTNKFYIVYIYLFSWSNYLTMIACEWPVSECCDTDSLIICFIMYDSWLSGSTSTLYEGLCLLQFTDTITGPILFWNKKCVINKLHLQTFLLLLYIQSNLYIKATKGNLYKGH
jgi:hypothetical protein